MNRETEHEEKQKYGNFAFLKDIDMELYKLSSEAEMYLFTNQRSAHMRKALERLVEIKEKEKKINPGENLKNRIKTLTMISPRALPIIDKIYEVTMEDGRIKSKDAYDLVREYGNSAVHHNGQYKMNYLNALYSMQAFYDIVSKVFEGNYGDFKVEYVPIEGFYPIKFNKQKNNFIPFYKFEIIAYEPYSKGSSGKYALIRIFNYPDAYNQVVIERNDDIEKLINIETIQKPAGIPKFEQFNRAKPDDCSLYTFKYEFNKEPIALDDTILEGMKICDKIILCKEIADIFVFLHENDRIFLRLLSKDSIFLQYDNNNYKPFITKFDYTKIDFAHQNTIVEELDKAKNELSDGYITKSIAPEWDNSVDTNLMNWGAVDIFALGSLFKDILVGKFANSVPTELALRNCKVEEDIIEFLDLMMSDFPEFRPSAKEVADTFEKAIKI